MHIRSMVFNGIHFRIIAQTPKSLGFFAMELRNERPGADAGKAFIALLLDDKKAAAD
ncbi:hypothetical protein ACFSR7_09130 [Cohnella sp. GCM10020058]|uniref:hypothetical protein n=1 Tax=Cohnella sp. GCM10020058 TaxID=3317330 RepID=UPI00363CF0FA